jgi:hypothetical protein
MYMQCLFCSLQSLLLGKQLASLRPRKIGVKARGIMANKGIPNCLGADLLPNAIPGAQDLRAHMP